MSLQFILGSAGQDHRTPMVTALAQQVTAHPTDQSYYLVPNHIKFETEVDVLSALKEQIAPEQALFAQTQVQVFSFTRLAWFFMKNEPIYQLPRISPAGLNMLIYQIIQTHADELTIFRGEVDRPGFVSQLATQLAEFKVGQVTAADLMSAIEQLDTTNTDLQAKLHDLMIIYEAFETQMMGKFVENTDLLNQLATYLEQQVDLQHAHFYLEGFSQLSAQERQLVAILIQRSASVTVALNLDHGYPQKLPDKTTLFFQSAKLYQQLYMVAQANRVPVLIDQQAKTARVSADLQALDTYWQASQTLSPQPSAVEKPTHIQIVQAANRYVEVSRVATQIRQLVATGNYRYRDFLVLTRHLDAYQTVIDPIFQAQAVPYFDDADIRMADHPFVELLNALFDVQRRNYRYADVFRVLKSELLLPRDADGELMAVPAYRQALALTENFVLKNGLEGQHWWTQDKDWVYNQFAVGDGGVQTTRDDQISAQINRIRRFVKQTLPPFFARLKVAATYTDAAAVLYQFVANAGVSERLMTWRDQAIAAGDLTKAGQPEQTWAAFCDILDEFHTILGDLPTVLPDFQALLQAGFAGAKFSQIPSTLDQVVISESGIVQANNRKITFIMGATADTMPDNQIPTTLLADNDRQDLSARLQQVDDGTYLRDDAATQLAGEPYLNYLAFMSGSERLIFSYPAMSDDARSGLQLSPYVARIKDYFGLSIDIAAANPVAEDEAILPFVGTRRTTLRHLVQASHDSQLREVPLSRSWLYVLNLLRTDPTYGELTTKLLGSLSYRNVPTQLTPDIVTQLYGTKINTSISKLEEYYANPYAYFLKYGLNLQERDVFALSPASTGEFFHATLDGLMKLVNDQKLNLAALDDQQLREMTDEVMAKLLDTTENPQFAILESSHRMGYIRQQLMKTMRQMAKTLQEQSKRTKLRPKRTEVQFGLGDERGLAALSFDVGKRRQVTVRGRIDRLDAVQVKDKTYLGIVDYKSSEHKFSYQEAYYGRAMQMLTYLDAVKQNLPTLLDAPTAKDAELAGAVYLHLQNPILKAAEVLGEDPLTSLLKAEQYQGLLLDDPDLLTNLDTLFGTPDYSGSSLLFRGLRRTKTGKITSYGKLLVNSNELDLLLTHTERLIKRAATDIFDGRVDLAPFREQNRTALQYSPYKSVMQFDPLLKENNYRDLPSLNKDDVMARIAAEQEQEATDEHEI